MNDSGRAPASDAVDLEALRGFLESLWNCSVVIDPSDRVVMANRAALALLGQPPIDTVIGQPIMGAFRVLLERMRARGVERNLARFEQYYDGAWYISQIFPLLGRDGKTPTAYTIVSATDIGERKRREFDLIETVAGLEEATRIAQMGTFKIIWETGVMEWSPHMYTLHGTTPDSYQPTRNGYDRFVHSDDRDYAERNGAALAQGHAMANVQYRIVLPDGAIRWVRLDGRVLFDSSGAPYASFGTCQDISESKLREEDLRELLRRNAILYEALEASPNGVAVLTANDSGFSVLYVNAAFDKLTQHNSFSLSKQGLGVLVPNADAWQSISEAMDQSRSAEIELTCQRRDNTMFPARIELAPVRDHPGRAASAFVFTMRDLTAEKERAAIFLQAQKMEALGQLSGGVAHEINNLLQPVIALSDLGIDVIGKDPAKARQYFDVIGNSGRKAREVVRQVLTFARRDTPQLLTQNLVPLISDAIDLAANGLPGQITLDTAFSLNEANVVISATQVSQVVLNLLRNASDAMNGNGTIRVTLDRCGDPGQEPAAISHPAEASWLRLAVLDTGCGIDPETRARLFEPFFTTKPVGKGTGLGLSVVYSIVTGWGGTIKLDSEVDKGTTAVIYIPEQKSTIA